MKKISFLERFISCLVLMTTTLVVNFLLKDNSFSSCLLLMSMWVLLEGKGVILYSLIMPFMSDFLMHHLGITTISSTIGLLSATSVLLGLYHFILVQSSQGMKKYIWMFIAVLIAELLGQGVRLVTVGLISGLPVMNAISAAIDSMDRSFFIGIIANIVATIIVKIGSDYFERKR